MIAAPPVALAVSPARAVVVAGGTQELRITNHSRARTLIVVRTAGYAVGLRGRPGIAARPVEIAVRPRRLAVPAGGTATVLVTAAARPPPGDHAALVLVASRSTAGRVGLGIRIGVLVLVRGTGRVVHRLVPIALRRRGPGLELVLRNAGTVSEHVTPDTVRIWLLPRGHATPEPRELLPHSRGIVTVRAPARRAVAAVVQIRGRTYRLRVAGRR